MATKKNKTTAAAHPAVAEEKKASSVPISKWAVPAILFFTALLYLKATVNGFTFIDDDYYILKNPFLHNFSWNGICAIFTSFSNYNYHPFTTLIDLFIYKYFWLDPLPYHLFNVLLHVFNVWLVYMFTEKLSSKKITGLVVAILFAIHPLHVESVAWVSELKDVLYSSFYLAALIFYLRYLNGSGTLKYYILTLVCFIAALFSKSAAVTLPVLLILIDVYKERKLNTNSLTGKIPFLLLSIVFGILAIKSQSSGGAVNDISVYYNVINRIFLFTSGIAYYFIELIAPSNLSALHFYPDISGNVLPWYYYLSLPFLLLILWLAARKSAYRKETIFGIVFFFVTISVMLQIITVGASLAAERYTYIPYIGLFYIVGQWVADNYEKRRRMIRPMFAFIAILFSIITWLRIDKWKDTDTLFTDIVEKNGNNWRNGMVYNSWGDFESYSGDKNSAVQKYTEAVRLFPRYPTAFYNRGKTLEENGNIVAAIRDYDNAIKLNHNYAPYYNSRGWVYYESGNKKAAMLDYDTALTINHDLPEAYNNRGWAYYEAGNLKAAMSDYNRAIASLPSFTKPYYNRAIVKADQGDLAGAVADYNALININNNDSLAYFNRGVIRMNQKDMPGACADWKTAMDMGYKNAGGMLQQYCK